MQAAWVLEPQLFSPSELERITGISPEVQRMWRSRGHLARNKGAHARFDPLAIAALMIRKELAHLALGGEQTNRVSSESAPHVVWWAITTVDGAFVAVDKAPVRDTTTQSTEVLQEYFAIPEAGAHRYLVRVDHQAPIFSANIESAFSDAEVGTFIDLAAVGRRLGVSAGRPILVAKLIRLDPKAPGTAGVDRTTD